MSWDLDGGFNTAPLVRNPRITIRIRCEYPDTPLDSTEVTFDWFLRMMREREEFVPHFVACFLRV